MYQTLTLVLLSLATTTAVREPPQYRSDKPPEPPQFRLVLKGTDCGCSFGGRCICELRGETCRCDGHVKVLSSSRVPEPPQFRPFLAAPTLRQTQAQTVRTVRTVAATNTGSHWHRCPDGHYFQHSGGPHVCPVCGKRVSRVAVAPPVVTQQVVVAQAPVARPATSSWSTAGVTSTTWATPTSVTYDNQPFACANCPNGVGYPSGYSGPRNFTLQSLFRRR